MGETGRHYFDPQQPTLYSPLLSAIEFALTPMNTDDIKAQAAREREQEYREFVRLLEVSDLLNPQIPPAGTVFRGPLDSPIPGEQIDEIYDNAIRSAYLKHFDHQSLKSALKDLEDRLAEFHDPEQGIVVDTSEVAKRRRALRFFYHLAQIVKWKGRDSAPPDRKKLNKARSEIAKRCHELEELLLDQLEDSYLVRKLVDSELDRLPKLVEELGHFGSRFKEIEPEPPYARIRDPYKAAMRQIVEELTRGCCLVYEHCTVPILRKILRSCWFSDFAAERPVDLQEILDRARHRKETEYLDRSAPTSDTGSVHTVRNMPVRRL